MPLTFEGKYAIYSAVATNYFEERSFDYRKVHIISHFLVSRCCNGKAIGVTVSRPQTHLKKNWIIGTLHCLYVQLWYLSSLYIKYFNTTNKVPSWILISASCFPSCCCLGSGGYTTCQLNFTIRQNKHFSSSSLWIFNSWLLRTFSIF